MASIRWRKGWPVLARDKNFRYKPNEYAAYLDASVLGFIFTAGDLSAAETALLVLRAYPDIAKLASAAPRPAIYSIDRRGQIRELSLAKRAAGWMSLVCFGLVLNSGSARARGGQELEHSARSSSTDGAASPVRRARGVRAMKPGPMPEEPMDLGDVPPPFEWNRRTERAMTDACPSR